MLKNIDWIKSALLFSMAACVFFLLQQWNEFSTRDDKSPAPVSQTQQVQPNTTTSSNNGDSTYVPELASVNGQNATQNTASNLTELVWVTTDVLQIAIDPKGGDIVTARLLKHSVAKKNPMPTELLTHSNSLQYIARSGLLGKNGTVNSSGKRVQYRVAKSEYTLDDSEEMLVVNLTLEQDEATVIKRFTFHRATYLIDVDYLVNNRSAQDWNAAFYGQIIHDGHLPDNAGGMFDSAYVGAAVTTVDDPYKKLDFDDISDKRFKAKAPQGWVALLQRYFMSAWIPKAGQEVNYDLIKPNANIERYFFGLTTPAVTVAANSQGEINNAFYVGPKDQYALRDIAEHLNLTVDYGWLWWAAQPIYALLYFIQSGEIHLFDKDINLFSGFGNWGLSIILLTLVIKLLFSPLSAKGYRSMARMKKFAPKMAELKERYGSDKQAISKETMALYKKEKINPLGGCFPILIQMPVFIALYWVLMESVEIRQAPFILWIQDLSVRDPWFVLPILMGASMWFMQRFNPKPADPTQAQIMQMMPIAFTFLFMWFPAGLVLYWTVNNLITMLQQWYVNNRVEAADKKT